MREFPAIWLLHGKGGSPDGSVSVIEDLLRRSWPGMRYVRPELPHGREQKERAAEESVMALLGLSIPEGSLMVGISMGGLVAAKLQEQFRADLHVIAISSPTWADAVELTRRTPRRIALYSSKDEVIADRVDRWPELAEAYDLPWLTHDTDKYRHPISHLINSYIREQDLAWEVNHINEASVI
jgi:pimeloyl-ACP methyl ester carboxylesterase